MIDNRETGYTKLTSVPKPSRRFPEAIRENGALGRRPLGRLRERAANSAFASHIPPGQLGRYLIVGAWNTIFGYVSFAVLTALLSPIIPYSYLTASLLASLLNITMAFLLYKHFVFRTKGKYWSEWARCLLVYSSNIVFNLALLPVIVQLIRHKTSYGSRAPYLAGALLTGFGVIYSFFGHRKFSFGGRS